MDEADTCPNSKPSTSLVAVECEHPGAACLRVITGRGDVGQGEKERIIPALTKRLHFTQSARESEPRLPCNIRSSPLTEEKMDSKCTVLRKQIS